MKKLPSISLLAFTMYSMLLISCEGAKKMSPTENSKTSELVEGKFQSNSLPNLEFLEIESKSNGQKYVIGIGLPKNYDSNQDKTYFVIYQLDGEGALHTSIETSRGMARTGDFEEVIIVGIYNYGAKSRWLDFTPSAISTPLT